MDCDRFRRKNKEILEINFQDRYRPSCCGNVYTNACMSAAYLIIHIEFSVYILDFSKLYVFTSGIPNLFVVSVLRLVQMALYLLGVCFYLLVYGCRLRAEVFPRAYLYVYTLFEGVCLTTVILAPCASEVELGAAALAPLRRDTALPRLNPPRSLFIRKLHT